MLTKMINDPFNFDNVLKAMDDINEATYGIRPYGTKKEEESTIQELTLSEMVGRPIKIKK